jgi:hypothetical protein
LLSRVSSVATAPSFKKKHLDLEEVPPHNC